MPTTSLPTTHTVRFALTLSIAVITLTACGDKTKTTDTTGASGGAPMTAHESSMSGMRSDSSMKSESGMHGMNGRGTMAGMAMTGDPDHDFLRMMSDHHKGLSELAHLTKDRKDVGSTAADARKMDAKQDQELDRMVTMLEKDFKDPYTPKVMTEHQAMADELKAKSGTDYAQTFDQDVIKHHQEAIKMIDDYLPKAKNATLKQMAERMKEDQTREIQELQQNASKS